MKLFTIESVNYERTFHFTRQLIVAECNNVQNEENSCAEFLQLVSEYYVTLCLITVDN